MKKLAILISIVVLFAVVGCESPKYNPDVKVEAEGGWWKEELDGHTYIIRGGGGYGHGSGIAHDPDCKCFTPNSSSNQ